MEKRIRQNLHSIAWQRRNPDKVKAQAKKRWRENKAAIMAVNNEWKRTHRTQRNAQLRQATKEMRPHYLRSLLRFHGITNPTPQDFEEQRQRVLNSRRKRAALKSSRIFVILNTCASLTKR